MGHLSVVFLPLLSFVFVGIAGPWLGTKISQFISCSLMALTVTAAVIVFKDVVIANQVIHHALFSWIECGTLKIGWGFYIDTVSAVMIMVVTSVSFLVHIYSVGYMSHDRTPFKFMAYLSFFTFMMLALVTGDNLLQVFFGWEGVGLASYLLIGYWYERPSACAASIKAFVVNRVGDLGLVLGMGCLFMVFETLDIPTILLKVNDLSGTTLSGFSYTFPVLEVIAFLLFFGAMGKSAQLGLHIWLPDAMEGPTPVSALIHAATMVTAGVFLVARFSALYALAPFVSQLMTWIGAITAVFAGTIALTQTDIKRVIAYSTCSQLGYMFFAEGLGAYHIALFHLTTHAFFKALLFLGAGSVIHAMSDEQDMRKMGGIRKYIPVTYALMWIGSAALSGIPFFAGYYSKDAILETALNATGLTGNVAYILGLSAAFLTAFYSWRLLYMTFHGKPRADDHVMGHIHEPGFTMLFPLVILAIGAIFSGYVGFPYFNSQAFWGSALHLPLHKNHETAQWLEYLPILISITGIGLATLFYISYPKWSDTLAYRYPRLYNFSLNKWYIDELYTKIITNPCLKLGQFFWTQGDAAVIDNAGLNKVADWSQRVAQRFSQMHTGLIFNYATWMIVGVIGMLLFLIIKNSSYMFNIG